MSPALQQHLANFAVDVFRLCVWLVLLTAVFVTLERLFALRRERLFRLGFATDVAYYFLTSLLPGVLMGAPLAVVFLPSTRQPFACLTVVLRLFAPVVQKPPPLSMTVALRKSTKRTRRGR